MEEKTRIFLCEDDGNIGPLLKEYLETKDYIVDLFADGEEGYANFEESSYDICILDIMMPRKDGYSLIQEIRLIDPVVPVIFLSAKSKKEDIIEGFKLGADDYVTKPFSMEELAMRIEALLRRCSGRAHKYMLCYRIGKYLFDTQKQTITFGDRVTKLTTKENDLLALLCANANETLERNFALKTIWTDDNYFNARSMDVYVTKLRKLLKDDPNVEIKNVHGKGYRLVTPLRERESKEMIKEI
ncbi:response regulator transcription factor RprY [Porphyromonas loveana]|uniref:DNA-binding response OmpR family regulator n=1 Tax=Porphyromonas loveana TaxID=1884669 RepID=A0A2U1FPL8_9PORP|nr:response regulator transcription factor [Porphyromonas loveana]PVZ14094.1 DNA-binding response OmpR family regulator [Porphyromonas loveana]